MRLQMRWAAAAALALLALGVGPAARLVSPAAQAQNFGQRVVEGLVVDANSANVAEAIVFLRNTKTKAIRSYTSAKDGRFRFVQVNMTDDFDLWAEKNGKKSPTRTVSSWDTRKDVEEILKLK